ncbi:MULTISPECIES: peptidoglycan DD-metalloendopeptidase family protein [Nitrospirillum]|uniref:peptidoglycan DD-metalloendopeptidase family protein n=1 Tax=Nitrospirillum amazonense TaxID=28077 RepID=UPI0011A037A1|nr:peptidoglycan DD-metalloendopeptidase family protein [Nitrospirillum amazonense]MEC4595058.1 peptidoglycan DD-metalloendopeptidase family protein [Nitrospirillum amazonense]
MGALLKRIAVTSAVALTLGGVVSLASLDDTGSVAVAPQALPPAPPSDVDPDLAAAAAAAPKDQQVPQQTAVAAADPAPQAGKPLSVDPVERRHVNVGRGDTLMQVLMDGGVPADSAQNAVSALSGVYDVRRMKAGQGITVLFDHSEGDKFIGLEFQPAAERAVSVAFNGGRYQARQVDKPLEKKLMAARGRITSSLSEAASAAGVPYPVLDAFIKRYAYDVDFQRDLQPGDTFEILFERYYTEDGQPARDGDIQFASLTLSGKEKAIYRYQASGSTADYYNALGESIRRAILRTPIDGARVTSGYGMRMHPVLGYSKMHKGKDFGAPVGTPIYAAGDGVVEQAGPFSSYGNYVKLRHGNQMETAYGHMSRIAKNLRAGMRVAQGDVIGYVGATGRATGPHLHFEVLRGNQQINPDSKEAKIEAGRKLDGKDLKQFQAIVAEDQEAFRDLQGGNGSTLVAVKPGTGHVVQAAVKRH